MTALGGMELSVAQGLLERAVEGLPGLPGFPGLSGWPGLAAGSVVSGVWQGLVLAAGVALCLRLMPRTTAAMRFTVWTGAFGVLALLPLLGAWLHAYSGSATAGAGRGAVLQVDERWSVAVAALWVMLSVVRGVNLAAGAVRLRGVWRRAVPVEAAAPGGTVWADGYRGAQLCTSAEVDRPSVIGFFSPRILIPEELYSRLTAAELEQIVLHETGHLRRSDDWWNLLQKVSLVLVPLNPALVWIERRLCVERELACDDDVLRLTGAPKAYATCLASLAEHRLGQRLALLSLGAWERRSQLARRVQRILRRGEAMSQRQARVAMASFAVVLLGGAAELARCPQLVSFSGGGVSAASLPVSHQLQGVGGAGFEPVVFRPASQKRSEDRARDSSGTQAMREAGYPHEVLLRAAMPEKAASAGRAIGLRRRSTALHHSAAVAPSLRISHVIRTSFDDGNARRGQGWMVLTAWTIARTYTAEGWDSEQQIPFGDDNQNSKSVKARQRPTVFEFSSSYAAVPTEAGWLVIQL